MSDGKATASTELAPAALPEVEDPSRVAAGVYKVDPDHTQVLFTFNHFGFSRYTGQFIQPAGSLTIDPARPNDANLEARPDRCTSGYVIRTNVPDSYRLNSVNLTVPAGVLSAN